MLVFAKEKLVFMALPKTGTTALETTLEPAAAVVLRKSPNLKHTPGFRYEAYLKTYLAKCGLGESPDGVCVCVNLSTGWAVGIDTVRALPRTVPPNSTKDMTFDAFVAEYAATDPAPFARVSYPPRFIRDNDGQVMVDHLFQYKQMPAINFVF